MRTIIFDLVRKLSNGLTNNLNVIKASFNSQKTRSEILKG